MQSVIGALRAILGMDSSAFEKGVGEAQKQLGILRREFDKTAKDFAGLGKVMSGALTAPLAAWGALSLKAGSTFEDAMRGVQKATGATSAQIDALSNAAKKLGLDTGIGASKAAEMMAELGKRGVSVTDILGGVAEATIKLAKANGADLVPAAGLADRIMDVFGVKAADLGGAVDKVTAVIRSSDLTFQDYAGALDGGAMSITQMGVKFEDFNTILAVTASTFANGGEAAASFRAFITKLSPSTKEAKDLMAQLGLNFFDASGKMKPLEQVAGLLNKQLGSLSDKSRIDVINRLFGRRAMGTALSLTKEGAEGVANMRAEIEKMAQTGNAVSGTASLTLALKKLSAAYEHLQIAIAQTGLLDWAARLVTQFGNFIKILGATDPAVLKTATIFAGMAAVIGPTLLAFAGLTAFIAKAAGAITRLIPSLAGFVGAMLPMLRTVLAIGAAAVAIVAFSDQIGIAADGAIKLSDLFNALLKAGARLAAWATESSGAFMDWAKAMGPVAAALEFILLPINVLLSVNLSTWVEIFVRALDAVANAFVGAFNVITVAWSYLTPVFLEIMDKTAQAVLGGVVSMVNAALERINWLRAQIGNAPIPPLKLASFTTENAGAMERAGVAIAEAWNKAFLGNFFTREVQQIANDMVGSAIDRMIGAPQAPPPVAKSDFGARRPKADASGGGQNVHIADSGEKSLATALQRIAEEKKALEASSAFLTTSSEASEKALFRKAEQLQRIGTKTAELLRGQDPDSETAKKIRERVTVLEEARDAHANLADSIKKAFEVEGQFGNGVAAHAQKMRELNDALATDRLSPEAFKEAARVAGEALDDQKNKFEGAKNGIVGFGAGFSYAADQMARKSTAFNMGSKMFDELTSAVSAAAQELLFMDSTVGDVLKRLANRIAAFAFETLALQPIFSAIKSMIMSAIAPTNPSATPGSPNYWTTPTGEYAPFAGGGQNSPGVPYWVGEEGPELRIDGPGTIIPTEDSMRLAGAWYGQANNDDRQGWRDNMRPVLRSDEQGDGGGNFTLVQHLNFSLGVKDTVKAEIRGMMPEIAQAGAERVKQLRLQGGNYSKAVRG